MSAEPALSDALVARILGRLAVQPPSHDAPGLAMLYAAWCRAVPWDNVQKRISVAGRHPVLAGAQPVEFFENWLRDSTGGTCWPSSAGWHALLVALGFEARRAIGSMQPQRSGRAENHATTIVRTDGEDWLVDSSMLNERPLALREGEATHILDALHPMRAEPRGGMWIVTWASYVRPESIECLLLIDDVPHSAYLERYELSRERGFSYGLTFRRNLAHGVLSLQRNTRSYKDRSGEIVRAEFEDRSRVLVDEGGLSPEIVARLPPDEPDPPS